MKMGIYLVMALLIGNSTFPEGETFQNILNHAREAYYDTGKYEECINAINQGIKNHPGDNAVVVGKSLLVSSYIKSGKYQEAKTLLDVLQREYPDSEERALWEYQKAYIDRKEGNYEASIEGFKRYLKECPEGERVPKALYNITRAYKGLHQYNLAIKYAEKLLKDYPDHNLAEVTELVLAGSLLGNKQYDEAAKKFKEYISKNKESKQLDLVYFSLGSCCGDPFSASEDKLRQALEYYNIVVKDFPDSVWAVSALTKIGMIYSRMKNYEQAIIYFNKYLELQDPRKRSGCDLYFLARFYEKNAEKEKAKNTFNRVIKNFPDSKWAQKAKKVLNEI